MISAIVAVDNNWGIGYNGDLLEHIPEDLKYFKELTTGHIVVMGRKTWDSLPKKPLKDRLNIVISSQPKEVLGDLSIRISMEEAKFRLALSSADEEWFIIGGGTIYKELLPICDRVYVTKILKDHENVDTYFPDLDKSSEWEIDTCTDLRTSGNINYAFLTYDRIS
jgi:dihydrofolate reductase